MDACRTHVLQGALLLHDMHEVALRHGVRQPEPGPGAQVGPLHHQARHHALLQLRNVYQGVDCSTRSGLVIPVAREAYHQ